MRASFVFFEERGKEGDVFEKLNGQEEAQEPEEAVFGEKGEEVFDNRETLDVDDAPDFDFDGGDGDVGSDLHKFADGEGEGHDAHVDEHLDEAPAEAPGAQLPASGLLSRLDDAGYEVGGEEQDDGEKQGFHRFKV